VIGPRRVVEMLHLTDVVIVTDLERANYEVRGLLTVGQRHSELAVLFLLTLDLWPVQLTLWLNTTPHDNWHSL